MKKWYMKYPKLHQPLFTHQNSGKRSGLPPPFHARHDENSDVIDIEGLHGMNQLYRILGYTEEPPFLAAYPAIAILFEDLHSFEHTWFHYERE